MPTLRHATLKRNLTSICSRGLLCSKSQGRLKVCWVHAASKTTWAMLHTVKRHGGRIEDVVVLEVNIPRSWLRRSKKRLWYSLADIPPGRVGKILTFAEMAASPVEAVA